jgi:hypothetical protein
VVLSVNVLSEDPRQPLGLEALVSVRSGEDWSPWFRMLRWGTPVIRTGELNTEWGRVDVDELQLSHPAREIRCRITWQSPGASSLLARVALCLAYTHQTWQSSVTVPPPVRHEVPFLSQWDVTEHAPGRVCSPTCLAMVARFHGLDATADALASLAYDPEFDVYGNWSVNMLAMSRLGFRAVVERSRSLGSLDAALDQGEPVVASIAFGRNELHGAPLEQSRGHLVVACGRTGTGDFLVRDPAARGPDDWREYARSQFEQAWLGHGGVCYRIRREGGL